jgi:hypothetical protein
MDANLPKSRISPTSVEDFPPGHQHHILVKRTEE